MDLSQAGNMARTLMQEHGLTAWRFTTDNARRRFGVCKHSTQTISVSLPLMRLNSESVVRDTILHEIAHAKAGYGAGHGAYWQKIAQEIGANPKRCYDSAEVQQPPKPWTGICPNTTCGRVVQRYRRARIACGKCCAGKFNAEYLFIWMRA